MGCRRVTTEIQVIVWHNFWSIRQDGGMDSFVNCRLSESLWSFCVKIVGRMHLFRVVILRITIPDRYIVIIVLLFNMMLISVNWFNDIMVNLGFIVIVMGPRMLVYPLLELITILRPFWMHREIA